MDNRKHLQLVKTWALRMADIMERAGRGEALGMIHKLLEELGLEK